MKKIITMVLAVLMLASCTGRGTVATVGDIKITADEFEFYLSSIKSQMKGTELQTDEDWETREIEGKKAIDVAKQRALDIAIENALYIEAAEAAGIKLTENEREQVKKTKRQIVSGYGGESAYKEFLKENNITDKFIEMMCKSTVYYNRIGRMLVEETPILDEEGQKYFEENKSTLESEYRNAKHILILTVDSVTRQPKSAEDIAKAKELAEDLLEQIKKGADFDSLMTMYSEDPGLESAPDGYVFGSGEMVPEFEQATDSVKFGEIAFCESSYGYHIIKRLPIEYTDVADRVKNAIVEERIDKKVKEWEEEYSLKITTNEESLKEIK